MMDVTENYAPDFIYTDGTYEGPFTGRGTGTGYKCNAMQTVIADYYNRQLKTKGKVDGFSIVKFRHPTNGTVNTAEFDFPDSINASQPWIREGSCRRLVLCTQLYIRFRQYDTLYHRGHCS